jgi:DnaJ domain
MESPTHYELLCVTPEATPDDIRAAYRRLVRMYHPDVAGSAGAAMTLRLNEAQRVLLDPDLRSRVDRPGSHSAASPSSGRGTSFARDTPRSGPAPRPAGRTSVVEQRSIAWEGAAITAIAVIVLSTIAVFAHTYSQPVGGLTPRVIPPIVIALVWTAAGLGRPPRFAWFLLALSMLLWPLAASGVWPVTALVDASPEWIWVALTASFVSAVVLRVAAPRVSKYRFRRSTAGRASTA